MSLALLIYYENIRLRWINQVYYCQRNYHGITFIFVCLQAPAYFQNKKYLNVDWIRNGFKRKLGFLATSKWIVRFVFISMHFSKLKREKNVKPKLSDFFDVKYQRTFNTYIEWQNDIINYSWVCFIRWTDALEEAKVESGRYGWYDFRGTLSHKHTSTHMDTYL